MFNVKKPTIIFPATSSSLHPDTMNSVFYTFYDCSLHSDIYIAHSPTNALFIKLGKF